MLQNIRDNASGALVMVIVGLICLAMLSGAGMVATSFDFGPDYAIDYGDTQVPEDQIGQMFTLYKNFYANNNMPSPVDSDEALLDQVVNDSFVKPAVVREYVDNNVGYPRADLEKQFMQRSEIAAAQTEAEKRAAAAKLLREANMSLDNYIQDQYVRQLEPQLRAALTDSAFATQTEASQAVNLRQQTRDITTLRYTASSYLDAVTPTDDDLQDYYEEHVEDYELPARVQVSYVEVSLPALRDALVIEDEELAAWYADNADRYAKPEERKVRDIVIAVDNDDDAAADQADNIFAQLQNGADFAELVKQYSDDPLSKASEGALGWLVKGQADYGENIDREVFSATVGEVLEPVEQDGAYHILIVDDVRISGAPELADVRVRAEADYRSETAQALYTNQTDLLRANYDDASPENLTDLIGNMALEVQESEWLEATSTTGIARYPEVRDAAFGKDIVDDQYISELISTADNERVFVLQYKAYEPAAQQTLDSVREQVTTAVKNQLAVELAQTSGEEALVRIEAGADLATVAEETKAAQQTVTAKTKLTAGLPVAVRDVAFQLPAPAADGVSVGSVADGEDFVLVTVSQVTAPNNVTETQTTATADQLTNELGRAEYEAFISYLVAEAAIDVDINRDNILNPDEQ